MIVEDLIRDLQDMDPDAVVLLYVPGTAPRDIAAVTARLSVASVAVEKGAFVEHVESVLTPCVVLKAAPQDDT